MSDSSRARSSRSSSNSTSSTAAASASAAPTSASRAQTFPLAHPPPKSSQCLRLSARLLLQIQQLNSASRAIPVLEIYQPPMLGRSVPNGQPKLHARDMFLTQSESFSHIPGASATEETTPPSHDLVGAIYTDPKRPADAGVYIPAGDLKWEASQTPRGYRFQLKRARAVAAAPRRPASKHSSVGDGTAASPDAIPGAQQGQEPPLDDTALDWERRARTSSDETNDSNAGSGGSKPDRFVLTIADQPSLRRPWLATLTKKGFMVGGWDRGQRAFLGERLGVQDDRVLYTCFLALGVYVARLEGWVS